MAASSPADSVQIRRDTCLRVRRIQPAAVLVIALLLTACAPFSTPGLTATPPPPTTTFDTSWGRPDILTWSATFDSPAIITQGSIPVAAAFEDVNGERTLVLYRGTERQRTNVTAARPYDLRLSPAPVRGVLATWLDDGGSGANTLFAAAVNSEGYSDRGPIAVSQNAVAHYAIAAVPAGGYWAIWSAPVAGEPILVGSRLDSAGRPRSPQALRLNADYPALNVLNDSSIHLYWLEGDRRDLYHAELTDTGVQSVSAIASNPWSAAPTDHLIRLDVGVDTGYVYVFWQVRTGLGFTEVWFSAGELSAQRVDRAQRLLLTPAAEPAQTGFNHGEATASRYDAAGLPVTWAQPARDQNETLPVTAVIRGQVGMIYFKNGAIHASQTLAALPLALIAAPSVAVDQERDLILAWWLPDPESEAVLYVLPSRR